MYLDILLAVSIGQAARRYFFTNDLAVLCLSSGCMSWPINQSGLGIGFGLQLDASVQPLMFYSHQSFRVRIRPVALVLISSLAM